MQNNNQVIGYVFNKDGFYERKHYFEGTAKNMATFIMQHQFNETTITDTADTLICTSVPGGFIDKCVDQNFLIKELQPAIIPLQLGDEEIEPLVFEIEEYDYMQVHQ